MKNPHMKKNGRWYGRHSRKIYAFHVVRRRQFGTDIFPHRRKYKKRPVRHLQIRLALYMECAWSVEERVLLAPPKYGWRRVFGRYYRKQKRLAREQAHEK